jgi:acyl-homoserine lactone acylase PvdQ
MHAECKEEAVFAGCVQHVLLSDDVPLLLRRLQESVELRPMYGASDASDRSAASDSGAASFLGQLWDAVQVSTAHCALQLLVVDSLWCLMICMQSPCAG